MRLGDVARGVVSELLRGLRSCRHNTFVDYLKRSRSLPGAGTLNQIARNAASQAFQVDYRCREIGLDLHVGHAASNGTSKSMPGLRLTVEAFRAPAVTQIKTLVLGAPPLAPPSCWQKSRVVIKTISMPLTSRR